ncbi:SDR family oxidoreductase [Tranquillimonas rosea]|uniref:SDR family oxidoreductase n=1 Tax=Tranquillimonas rosea TaxID=641238 RepID=UPI000B872FF9|nr:SDR family oxidoreductase [Tranquillimonas rosea]
MDDTARTALVTGAGAGIGRGTALHLARRGWRVAALDRDARTVESLVGEVGEILPLVADVSDEGDVRRAVTEVSGWSPELHLLVNNAGIADPLSGPVEALSLDAWNDWIGTNLTGAFLMVKHCVPLLRAGEGAIVNVSSTRAQQSEPDCEAYAASKGGLSALTHALAVSLGPAIRVNAVAPGWIDTTGETLRPEDHAQHPAGRVGQPDDVAAAIRWLADEAAGFVTGQVLTVDGGMTRKMIYRE